LHAHKLLHVFYTIKNRAFKFHPYKDPYEFFKTVQKLAKYPRDK